MKKILAIVALVTVFAHSAKGRVWTDDAWIGYAFGVDANDNYVFDKKEGGLKTYGSTGTKCDSKETITQQLLSYCNKMVQEDKWKKAGVVKCKVDITTVSGQKMPSVFGPDNPGCFWIFYTEKEGVREMVGITSWGVYPEGTDIAGQDRASRLAKEIASGEHKEAKKCLMCRGLSDCATHAISNAGVEFCPTIHKP